MFEATLKYLNILGINSDQSAQKLPLNLRSLMILLLCSFFIVSSVLYLFYVPNSFDEYIESINISSTAIVNTIYLLVFLWKIPKLFEFLQSLENIIQMGKLVKIKSKMTWKMTCEWISNKLTFMSVILSSIGFVYECKE